MYTGEGFTKKPIVCVPTKGKCRHLCEVYGSTH